MIFEDLVRMVAKEANALVPIISFKEVAKDDWRQQLPEIIKAGLGRAPEMVICTHLDQLGMSIIAPLAARPYGSECTSTTSAVRVSKPNFEDIWVEGRVAYDCAEKILGVGNPKTKYEVLEFDEWKEVIVDQLKESELESAITRLTTDIAMTKRGYILKVEGEQLHRMISKSIVDHNRLLSVMGRSQLQFELAYAAFKEIRLLFAEMLEDWRAEENRSQAAYMEKLHKAIHVLQLQGLTVAAQATEKTMSLSHWRKNIGSDVEFFVVSIQREMHSLLGSLKRQFVSFVRELANRCRAEYFDSLRDKIQKTIRDDAQNELMTGILDRLDAFGEDIEALLLPNIMKKVVHSIVAERYNAATAHRAIRNAIVGPLLTRNETSSNGTDADWTDVSTETSSDESASIVTEEKDIQQLGFMLRAPVAVLATIPWFLGVGVWLFMARSKQYLLNVESLIEELQERAIRPYFDGLHEEGVTTLENIGERSSKVAELAIHESLEEEERRYQQERSLKQKERSQNEPPRPIIAVSSMTLLLNLLAADSGLLGIQRHLTESKVVND
ncbi:hypothetical protein A0H81_13702 [Grifola frondosa]|uniref:Uncharacterized protein n=1 Tax=Grifola frondosa TaxID=5627 RepID=A0A1C7LNS4_GRIFR|nr:hypothetical protein A0H81_13702 [Grifola frondosa]